MKGETPQDPATPQARPSSRGTGGPRTPRAKLAEPLLQAPIAVALAAFALAGNIETGALAFAVMVAVWPPVVRWLPLRAVQVAAAYVPFAIVWLGATIGYLHLMHSLGATVVPQPMLERLAANGVQASGGWLLVVAIVVIGPVAEEILFRGYLWGACDLLLRRPWTHALTAVLFGLMHGLHYALPTAALGLFFGWLRARHDCLLAPILAHALHNGVTVAVTLCWPSLLDLMYPG